MRIYAFSGLGADQRVFDFLNLEAEVICVPWITPFKDEDLTSYSKRLGEGLELKGDFALLGLSFGGLVAVELNKMVKAKRCILISSIESQRELPALYKWIGRIRIMNLIPSKLLIPPKFLGNYLFSARNKKLLGQILNDSDAKFNKWALNQLLTWKNERLSKNVTRIHGDKDKLLMASQFSNVHWVKSGGHFMIVDRSKVVEGLINKTLRL